MPWIEEIPPERAEGLLKREYEAAVKRAGHVWHIVSIMSQNPEAMRGSMRFYRSIMHGDSPLSRVQRELLATVTSAELDCFY
jgi:alkylhydroperoxidase family enzyme